MRKCRKNNVFIRKRIRNQLYLRFCGTDIFYIAKKELKDRELALNLLKDVLKTIRIASVTEYNINEALSLNWNDFEDSVQYVIGKSVFAEYIVTRNTTDYSKSRIKVVSPDEFFGIAIGGNI